MSSAIIFFVLTLLVPVVVAFFLRVNAAILFMSVCVGAVLVQFISSDSASIMSMVSPNGQVSNDTVKIILLLLPAVLTTVFMMHSVHGQSKLIFNIIPALGTGVLIAFLIEPLLSGKIQMAIETTTLWKQFSGVQTFAVVASAFLSLIFLWFHKRGSGKEPKHHSHAKKAD